jgi:lactate dehydrogenase-like 2-hydroxyacid dehydrogenase
LIDLSFARYCGSHPFSSNQQVLFIKRFAQSEARKEIDMRDKQKVGWIGLGKMGIPISQNLLNAGYPLTVYNRTKEKTKAAAGQGARVADSPKALAAGVDVIISMISDNTALEAISIGAGGAFEGAGSGAIFNDRNHQQQRCRISAAGL